ncbi:MAG: protein kinase [Deltaproteobacteria bacterium]|nr:protein kinase [Deltaproteobacteria bacterium]
MAQAGKTKRVFDGRYEVLGIVGRGSCSVVYHARYLTAPASELAIKVLINKKGQGSNTDRLRKEALAMVSSRHRYVIRLDDFHSVDTLCYLSMEYAPESDLRTYIKKTGGRLPLLQAERFLLQMGEALSFMHQCGIVHRDIKPDNILIVNARQARLGDFGVAVLPGEKASIEELERGVGTMDYMAPEVFEGSACDARSDVYALALSFYEVLGGHNPFTNVPLAKVLEARKDANLKRLEVLSPRTPKALAEVIMTALAYEPSRRYANGQEFLNALLVAKAQHESDQGDNEEPEAETPRPASKQVSSSRIVNFKAPTSVEPPSKNQKPRALDLERSTETAEPAKTVETAAKLKKRKRKRRKLKPAMRSAPKASDASDIPAEPKTDSAATDQATPTEIKDFTKPFRPPLGARPGKPSLVGRPTPFEQPRNLEPVEPQARSTPTPQDRDTTSPPRSPEIVGIDTPYQTGGRQPRTVSPLRPPTAASERMERPNLVKVDLRSQSTLTAAGTRSSKTGFWALLIVVLALFAADFLLKAISEKGLVQRAMEVSGLASESSPIPPVDSQDFEFPSLPAGMYSGTVSDLIPGETLPLAIISMTEQNKLIFLVGLEGWNPAEVSLAESDDGKVRVRSNGLVLLLSARNQGGELVGEFTNLLSNSGGTWQARPLR